MLADTEVRMCAVEYAHMQQWGWQELHTPLFDLLLSFYNDDFTSEPTLLMERLNRVFEILNFWRIQEKISGQEILTPKNLLEIFVDIVLEIIEEVRKKLLFKAADKFGLIKMH